MYTKKRISRSPCCFKFNFWGSKPSTRKPSLKVAPLKEPGRGLPADGRSRPPWHVALQRRPAMPVQRSNSFTPRGPKRKGAGEKLDVFDNMRKNGAGFGEALFSMFKGHMMTEEQAAACVQTYWRRYQTMIQLQYTRGAAITVQAGPPPNHLPEPPPTSTRPASFPPASCLPLHQALPPLPPPAPPPF